MTDLLPCPFCGSKPEIIEDRTTTWALIEHKEGCLFPTFPKHEIRPYDWEAWNTRAERTCERVTHGLERDREIATVSWTCSECGAHMGRDYNYCPNCGGKVER